MYLYPRDPQALQSSRVCGCVIIFASRTPWQNFPHCDPLVLTYSCSFLSSVSHPLTLYITYVHLYRAQTQSFSPCSRLRHVLMYRDFSLFFFFFSLYFYFACIALVWLCPWIKMYINVWWKILPSLQHKVKMAPKNRETRIFGMMWHFYFYNYWRDILWLIYYKNKANDELI